MTGNVWEWSWEARPAGSAYRVTLGGGWQTPSFVCYIGFHNYGNGSYPWAATDADGFRICRSDR